MLSLILDIWVNKYGSRQQVGVTDCVGLNRTITLTGCCAGVLWVIASGGNYTLAQITPDGTLGTENSRVTPNVTINGSMADQIEGGAIRGANLFHSFEQFNIGEGQRVYFANPVGIETILSRVTGTDPSDILGTLGVGGRANLFFINPNGIIFGKNARLDIAGSFVASTANSLVLGHGVEFSAENPEAPPLLTINITPGLQYGSNHANAAIANRAHLAVGQDLILSASHLDLQGQLTAGRNLTLHATDTVNVRDSVLSPFIASSGSQLLVQGNQAVDIFALNHPSSGFFSDGDLIIRSITTVGGDAHYTTGGSFRIETLDGTLGNLYSPYDPVIRASGDVTFNSYSGTSLHIFAGGSVTIPGNVAIAGAEATNFINELVTLSDGQTTVAINGSTQPTLDIRAGTTAFGTPGIIPANSVGFTPRLPGTGGTPTSAAIAIGSITITAPNGLVFLSNQYAPNLLLTGGVIQVGAINTNSTIGNGSSVVIDSRSDILLTGNVSASTIAPNSNGGKITLHASNGNINTGNLFSSSEVFFGNSGQGGNISVRATNGSISIGNIDAYSYTDNGNSNRGGEITLSAINGNISAGNLYSDSSTGAGNAGEAGAITLTTTNGNINTRTLGAYSYTANGASNNGSNIILSTTNGNIAVDNLYSYSYAPRGESGNSGNILLGASNGNISANSLNSASQAGGFNNSGNGGAIAINANDVNITRSLNSSSSANTGTVGNGGAITINASNNIDITGDLSAYSEVFVGNTGNGGAITINANNMTIKGGLYSYSSVTSVNEDNSNVGNGGEIRLNAAKDINIIGSLYSNSNAEGRTGENKVGNGGGISVYAANNINIKGGLTSDSFNGYGSTEDGGAINITASQGAVNIGGFLVSRSYAARANAGNGGDITITAFNGITIGTIFAESFTYADRLISYITSGKGGNVTLTAINGDIQTSSIGANSLVAYSGISGQGGTVNITANNGSIKTREIFSFSNSDPVRNRNTYNFAGSGGAIALTAIGGDITTGSLISSGGTGSGNITVTATGAFSSAKSIISTSSYGAARSGDIQVTARSVSLKDGTQVSTSTSSQAPGGNLTIIASDFVELSGGTKELRGYLARQDGLFAAPGNPFNLPPNLQISRYIPPVEFVRQFGEFQFPTGLFTQTSSTGNAGSLSIETGQLILRDRAVVAATTFGAGKAGDISVQADNVLLTNGSILSGVGPGASGTSGSINLQTRFLTLTEGGIVQTLTLGEGKAGDIQVNASESVQLLGVSPTQGFSSGLLSGTEGTNSGPGGNISVTTPVLAVRNGAVLSAQTLSNSIGGTIAANVNTLEVTGGGQLLTSAFGSGRAGNIQVNATDSITLSGTDFTFSDRLAQFGAIFVDPDSAASGFSARTEGAGAAGNVTLTTPRLTLENGAQISASTSSTNPLGVGGSITVNAPEIQLIGSDTGLFAQTTGAARAGNLTIQSGDTAPTLTLNFQDGAKISASTSGSGVGGTLSLSASDAIAIRGNGLLSVETTGDALGGNLTINTRALTIEDGATASASTSGTGKGGTLTVEASQSIDLRNGSRLVAQSTQAGDAGDLRIVTESLTIQNDAQATVSSVGSGKGGTLDIAAASILLSDRGKLIAQTTNSDGGNIQLSALELLLMRNNSLISATAGGTGNGGNIAINADNGFIVAVPKENSDITANASEGRGGNINITATGIYGLEFRPRLTPLSDITASSDSGVDGVVDINKLDIDPVRGLVNLPSEPATTEVAQDCQASGGKANGSFINTGRGGLPNNPYEPLSSNDVLADVHPPTQWSSNSASAASSSTSPKTIPERLTEATRWIVKENGEVVLVAEASPTSSSWGCRLR